MKKIMMIAVAALFLSAQGMAQSQLTPEQKEQRQAMRMENRCIMVSSHMSISLVGWLVV